VLYSSQYIGSIDANTLVLVSVHTRTDFSSLSKQIFTTASKMSYEDTSTLHSGGCSVAPCGLSFTPKEDLMIMQAYCTASEDLIRGDYQKANDIKEKMQFNYMELCIKYTKINHASLTHTSVNNRHTNKQLKTYKPGDNMFVLRTAESIWKRFKTKIGQDCMAMNGVTASNPCLSGENEDQYWERLMAEFENREGVKFKFPKIYKYLKKKLKGKVYLLQRGVQLGHRSPKAPSQLSGWSLTRPVLLVSLRIWETRNWPTTNQPPAGNPNQQHNKLIKMIEGQSKSLYQFGLMLTASTLSPAWKQPAIAHLLANLETKRSANKEKKGRKVQLKEWKLALMQAPAEVKHPQLLELSEEDSNTNNDEDKP
jgi:hypothetical protein